MSKLDDAISALQAETERETSVVTSVLTLLQGIPALIDDAVQKALAAGATPAELSAITAAVDAIKANSDKLAAAVQANTPAAPTS